MKKVNPCWPFNYRQGKERHRLSNHLCKAHYKSKIIDQSAENPKRFWNYNRHYTKSSSSIDILELDGRKFTKDSDKAEILNSFFCSVLTDDPLLDFTTHGTPTTNPIHILRDITITADDIWKNTSQALSKQSIRPRLNKRECPQEQPKPWHHTTDTIQSINTNRTSTPRLERCQNIAHP